MAYKVFKYRIYPNKEQRIQIEKTFGCARFLYNKYVDWMQDEYNKWKEDHSHKSGSCPLVTEHKKNFKFLKDVDNAALAYARSHFERAKNDFYKSLQGKRKGKPLGVPKHKKKGVAKFSYRTCDAHGTIKFSDDNEFFRLPKVGWVECVKHRDYEGTIKAVTVYRTKTYKYYICVMTEVDDKLPHFKGTFNDKKVVGLDMSLSSFCVSSNIEDDAIIKYDRRYRKNQKRLARLQRRFSKKS